MKRMRRTSNKIVPGRKMLSDEMQLHYLGENVEDRSYLAEKTADESAFMDCSQDREERMWRKQGLSEKEILRIQEQRALKKHVDAANRLEREKYGAVTFEQMCALRQYSFHDEEEEAEDDNQLCHEERLFAVPALPKHVHEKSTVQSPVGRSQGKPGFSCSTPVGGKDLSMRSLKVLDISHVVNTDKLRSKKVNVQNKNVIIAMGNASEHVDKTTREKTNVSPNDGTSELQETFIVRKEGEASLQSTFVVVPGADESLQGTFVKEAGNNSQNDQVPSASCQGTFVKEPVGNEIAEQSQSSSLQGTFVKESGKDPNDEERSASLQGTFVKDTDENEQDDTLRMLPTNTNARQNVVEDKVIEDVVTAENTVEGGKNRRRSKKVDLRERERRNADLSSFVHSMIDDAPSPGAHFFKNNRKKMRPSVATPPRTKFGSRLSTESDKEKTIEMMSIGEEATMESNGTSFADPISVNGSRVSPIPEKEETQPIGISDTPKSSRRARTRPDEMSVPLPVTPRTGGNFVIAMPVRNYEKPTASSLAKNKNAPEVAHWEAERVKERKEMSNKTPKRTPARATVIQENLHRVDEPPRVVCKNRSISPPRDDECMEDEPTVYHPGPSNTSIGAVEADLNALSVNERYEAPADFDSDEDYGRDEEPEAQEEQEEVREVQEPSVYQHPKPKSTRRGVGLLSDSLITVNTPGLNRRSSRNQRQGEDTVVDDGWNSDEDFESTQRNRRQNAKQQVGLQLAKRKIIEPVSPADGLRRSTRTRVKPLRSWLGEQAVYVNSPSGGKRLKGVTDVFIKDKRLCKYRTADLKLATEREQAEKARKKARAAQKRRELALDQSMGRRLDESQDEILTSGDEAQ